MLPTFADAVFRAFCNRGLAPVFFFVSGHEVPLFRNVDHLLLDKGIARLFGAFFALSRLGAPSSAAPAPITPFLPSMPASTN
jgi:hypothetical protein